MIFALAKLAAVIPDFNARSLNEQDYFAVAQAENITTVFDAMPILKGFCVRAIVGKMPRDYIFLDYRLQGLELVFTAYHELSHHFLHIPRRKTAISFYGLARPSKEDSEADAGALLCLYPLAEIANLPYRLIYADPFEAKLIKKRLAVHKKFGV